MPIDLQEEMCSILYYKIIKHPANKNSCHPITTNWEILYKKQSFALEQARKALKCRGIAPLFL